MSRYEGVIKIKVINDIEEPFPFNVISTFVNDKPYIFDELILKSSQMTIQLSDVSTQQALNNGSAEVLIHPSTQKQKSDNEEKQRIKGIVNRYAKMMERKITQYWLRPANMTERRKV